MGPRYLSLALAMLSTQTMATTVQFNNRCGHAIDLIKTVPSVAGTQECDLQPGESCTKNYDGPGFNFKHTNAGKSVTQAEFTFNDAAQKDFYNLSVVDGFNVAIQITSDKGGPTLTCE
ncbi:hypothetical protein RvY_11899 [Ramazzottius varieornatus]|uniref:Uncharacterized protein n=1 Tax=Ramazzottius varieornatus TaxID=947166 RepID=A0A1D1VQB8_RAMVA|nr:hypothetical protein RvY_11899 [Ramazzottius varieornatus]